MAKPGPRTQPTILKLLRGNPGRRKLQKNELTPEKPIKIPSPPKELNKIAKKEWRRMAKDLYGLGLLTNFDLTAFRAYCVIYAQWVQAVKQIEEHGMLIKAQSGFPMQSPYLQIANKAQAEIRKWLVEFGMTPSSRTGLKTDKPKPKSKAQAFRDRKNGEAKS